MIGYQHDFGWWRYAGMGIGMLIFSVLVIAAMVVLIRLVAADRWTPKAPPQSAERVLAAMYARGEISENEYRQRLSVLRDPTQH